jgi:hypothetical protein
MFFGEFTQILAFFRRLFSPLNEQGIQAGFSPGPEGYLILLQSFVGLKPHASSVNPRAGFLYTMKRNALGIPRLGRLL